MGRKREGMELESGRVGAFMPLLVGGIASAGSMDGKWGSGPHSRQRALADGATSKQLRPSRLFDDPIAS